MCLRVSASVYTCYYNSLDVCLQNLLACDCVSERVYLCMSVSVFT